MNDNILDEFKGYLISKLAVNEKYVPYYARWVSSCYAFVNQSLSDLLTNRQKEDFFKHFAKNHEDWQVKQAEAALMLYDYYLSGNRIGNYQAGINTYIASQFCNASARKRI